MHYYGDVNSAGHAADVEVKGLLCSDGGVIKGGPGVRDRSVLLPHHPIRLKDLMEVGGQSATVVQHHSKFFDLI